MAQLIIDVPDAIATRALNLFAAKTGWTVETGLTKLQWAKQETAKWIKSICVGQEADVAGSTAYQSQLTTSQSELDIT